MKFITDKSGAPAVRFSEGKFINVLPVTKYQFERFIWKSAPLWCDYKKMIEDSARISPVEVNKRNLSAAFMTNINFEEALEFSEYFGLRLPTVKEWDEVYDILFREDLFKETLEYMEGINGKQKIDRRVWGLIKSLHSLGIKRSDLNSYFGELVCEFPVEPFGRIYLAYSNKRQVLVTGSPSTKTRDKNFGFCGVLSEV